MELKLRVISGKQAGREIAIAGPKFLIGRAEDNHLRPSSELIGRHHCELLVQGATASVKDLGSKNGTLVNDQCVTGERILQTGDRLTIGQLQFEVQLTTTPQLGGPKRPKVADAKEAAGRLRATAANEEVDIAAWLTETPSPETAHDTDKLSMSDTGQFTPAGMPDLGAETVADVNLIPEAATPQTAAEPPAAKDAPASTPPKGTKFPGKLTPPPTANSCDAAADFLRKMAKYR